MPERPGPSRDDERLLELAMRLADDDPVDWADERDRSGTLRGAVEQLGRIGALAETHRTVAAPSEGATMPSEPESSEPVAAFRWGPLAVIEKLGEGGFGEVWRAWDPALRREVALKLRAPGAPADAGPWLREARALARVRHPNVVTVHGADEHDGRAGIWTDLVRGRTLEQLLAALGPMSAREATTIGLDLCAALASVHAAGLVHGDVKTRNVMREGLASEGARAEGAGRLLLMDFGASHDRHGASGSASAGTPLATAPERLRGGPPTVAGDIYALGVLLYRLVTLRYPVEAATLDDLLIRLDRNGIEPLRARRPDLPIGFVQVVERALDRDPARRHPTAAMMERALAAERGPVAGSPPAREARRHLLAGALTGAAFVGAAWALVTWLPGTLRERFTLAADEGTFAAVVRTTIDGERPYARFGASVGAPGDLDGDTVQDLVVCAPGEGNGRGRVSVLSGRSDGTLERTRVLDAPPDIVNFGHGVYATGARSGANDPAFIVGAPSDVAAGRGAGDLFFYRGGARDVLPAFELRGDRANQDFGFSAATGDFNGDGRADLAVGAPVDDAAGRPTGRVFVYRGTPLGYAPTPLELATVVPDAQYGYAVADVGDFNGDGFDDLAVGAQWDPGEGTRSGRVYIYYGGPHFHTQPDLVLSAPQPGGWFGSELIGSGDLNGEGFADLAVGASRADGFESGSGVVYVYFGGRNPSREPARVLRGPVTGAGFGQKLAHVDVDGDGVQDLLVAAPNYERRGGESGSVFVFRGGANMAERAIEELDGAPASSQFGWSMAVLPSPVSGALATIAVGAPATGSGGQQSGAVELVDFVRYAITRPVPGERWVAGRDGIVAWTGSAPARVDVSWDDGAHFTTVAARAGGSRPREVRVPVRPGVRRAIVRLTSLEAARRGTASVTVELRPPGR